MIWAGLPAMSEIPKLVVEPKDVLVVVLASAYVRGLPTVALRLPLSKSHWPVGAARVVATPKRLARIVMARRFRLRVFFMAWGGGLFDQLRIADKNFTF